MLLSEATNDTQNELQQHAAPFRALQLEIAVILDKAREAGFGKDDKRVERLMGAQSQLQTAIKAIDRLGIALIEYDLAAKAGNDEDRRESLEQAMSQLGEMLAAAGVRDSRYKPN